MKVERKGNSWKMSKIDSSSGVEKKKPDIFVKFELFKKI